MSIQFNSKLGKLVLAEMSKRVQDKQSSTQEKEASTIKEKDFKETLIDHLKSLSDDSKLKEVAKLLGFTENSLKDLEVVAEVEKKADISYWSKPMGDIENSKDTARDMGVGHGTVSVSEEHKPLVGIPSNSEVLPIGKHNGVPDDQFDSKELSMGIEVEMEHTDNKDLAKAIAKDHLSEFKDYYTRLKTVESPSTEQPKVEDSIETPSKLEDK